MVVVDFQAAALDLAEWVDDPGLEGGLPSTVLQAVDSVFRERATRMAHVFVQSDTLAPIPLTRGITIADFERTSTFEWIRGRWETGYLSPKWLQRIASWVVSAAEQHWGGRLHAALRQRIAQDLHDIARNDDPDYAFARQKVNRALREGGYQRCRLEGAWWVGRQGLTVAELRELPALDSQGERRIRATATAPPRGKQARASWWVDHWFATEPNTRAPIWQVVHLLLRVDPGGSGRGAAGTGHSEPDARDRSRHAELASRLLRKIRAEVPRAESTAIFERLRLGHPAVGDGASPGDGHREGANRVRDLIEEACTEFEESEDALAFLKCFLQLTEEE